jgi:predicted lysophospholipase L1 biosynthesis ABC-type transport system permease subunit
VVAIPALGHCPAGAVTGTATPDLGGGLTDRASISATRWTPVNLTPAQLESLPIHMIVVGARSPAAVEQARTVLEDAVSLRSPPTTLSEFRASNSQKIRGYRQLANVVIVASLLIAGCSLAVAVAGSLAERKRPFSLLRLTGAPIGMLRRVITIESAAPLLITAALSAGSGLLAAQLFLRAQLSESMQSPGAAYYLLVVAGLGASLAIIASTLPLLTRMTGPETARNE